MHVDLLFHFTIFGFTTFEQEDELARFIAMRYYIENGSNIVPGKLQSSLHQVLLTQVFIF